VNNRTESPSHLGSVREAELSAAEESVRLLVQSVQDLAIVMLDAQGRVSSWNPGAQHIMGYRTSEIVGQPFSRLYTAEDVAAGKPERLLEESRRRARAEDEGWRVRKDGSRFWANSVITTIVDDRGTLRGFAKMTRDVTERRRLTFLGEASAALSASLDYETTLASVARLSVPFLADWALVQLIEGDRLRTMAIAHIDPKKVELGWELDRRHPVESGASSGPWRVIQTGKAEIIEAISDALLDASDERRRVVRELGLCSAMIVPLVAQGRALGVITYLGAESRHHYDVGTLRVAEEVARRAALAIVNARAHQDLERERAWLRQVLDQMPAGVVIAEALSGRTVLSNAAVEQAIGGSLSPGSDARRLAHKLAKEGRLLEPDELPLSRALQGESVVDEELTSDSGGREAVFWVSAAPVRDRDGRIVSAVSTFRDITKRRQAQLVAEQEAKFRERFIAILGHDLRNPLAAILNSAQLLLRGDLAEAERRAVARVVTCAERMSRMIADVLDLARSRQGSGIPIAPRPTSLRDVCREVVEELRLVHPSCDFRLDADAPAIGTWDGDRLAQAVSNVAGNAAQYGRKEGPVCIGLADDGSEVVVSIRNEGAPIAQELLPNIFDPFRRGDSPEGHRAGGLGLGLYIAHQIVLAHGGSIDVQSDESGTTVTLRLPRRQDE
jgi:PAS domain S-box-containing protein